MVQLAITLLLAISLQTGNYMEPEQTLIDIVDAEWSPRISISPDFNWCLLRTPRKNSTILELSQPEMKLAGIRFRPATLAPTRITVYTEMTLMNMETLEIHPISGLPDNLRALSRTWSPDGSMVAFTNETAEGVELWLIETATHSARQLIEPTLNLTAKAYPKWLPSNEGLLVCLRTENLQLPLENPIPDSPIIQETTGEVAPVRTYQDLLKNSYDEELFKYYLTSQLSLISVNGEILSIGSPAIIWDFEPAPVEDLILVTTLNEPFSYSLTASRFPTTINVQNLQGEVVHTVVERPALDNIPIAIGSTYTGPRSVEWRSDAAATLCWVEALDNGDVSQPAEFRDEVFLLEAPFESEPQVLALLENRYGGVNWATDSLALISEWWWPTRNERTWRITPDYPGNEKVLLFDYSWEDAYNDPGKPITILNENGRKVLFSPDGESIWMSGDGASPEGNIPFLNRTDLNTLEIETVFTSQAPYYERPMGFADNSGENLLFLRESQEDYPNYFIRNIADGSDRHFRLSQSDSTAYWPDKRTNYIYS